MKQFFLRWHCFPFVHLSLLLSILALGGCAEFNSDWNQYSSGYNDPYAQSDFDELLAFGDNMANTPPSSRAKVCKTLLKQQKGQPPPGVVLHLMVGRLLSDSCGEIPRILAQLRGLPPRSLYDNRTRKLVAIHTEALKRLYNGSRRVGAPDCRQKASQSPSGAKNTGGSKSSETQLLREKLEAIRSMEKQMDESGDAQ